jgi:hypothetical protein
MARLRDLVWTPLTLGGALVGWGGANAYVRGRWTPDGQILSRER